ncbi:hypothetical protein CTAYLR_009134 [Chrysophaeum taylorii]|uniref:MYND-type domain-containing protein n=1 Tax=Chrysophaeum taylorii TaxID=2483200 RepID=A0AAD7XP34_9STRA|nr:hypothetical protein CTAYLR_009134 [Chrysophaeum taylorii]
MECQNCGVSANSRVLRVCGRCRAVAYCSKACQREAWRNGGHKQVCRKSDDPDDGSSVERPANACPICLDALAAARDKWIYMACCNKGMCASCHERLVASGGSARCVLCRRESLASLEELVETMERHAAKDDALANSELGYLYLSGQLDRAYGSDECKRRAVARLDRAVARGHLVAAQELGLRYYRGDLGGAPDPARAARYYEIAADAGSPGAQYDLANLLVVGDGVPRNSARAARYLRKAADHGIADAQYLLARLYGRGDGVPKDDAEMLRLFESAAARGHDEARGLLEKIRVNDPLHRQGRLLPVTSDIFRRMPLRADDSW